MFEDWLNSQRGLRNLGVETVWDVLRRGIATMGGVGEAIRRLAQLPWATQMAEAPHSSTTVMSRSHPVYDLVTVRVRACNWSSRKWMPSWTADEKAIRKLR